MEQDVIILVLSCLGVAQALFLSVYLCTKKEGDRMANVFLALVILGLTIRVGKSGTERLYGLGSLATQLGLSGILLTGPFLWFYGQRLLAEQKKTSLKHFIHLLPFALMVLLCIAIPMMGAWWPMLSICWFFFILAVYLGLSFIMFFKHRKTNHPQRALWYRNLVIGTLLIWLFYMGHLAGLFSYYIGGPFSFPCSCIFFPFYFCRSTPLDWGSTMPPPWIGPLRKP